MTGHYLQPHKRKCLSNAQALENGAKGLLKQVCKRKEKEKTEFKVQAFFPPSPFSSLTNFSCFQKNQHLSTSTHDCIKAKRRNNSYF